jgi:repressor LexA
MNDITIRFLDVYEYLRKEKLVHTPKGFANEIQVSTSLITEICKKRTNAGITPIQNLINRFPQVNSNWLLTGEGDMLKDKKLKAVLADERDKGYPLINVTAIGGVGNSVFSFTDRDIKAYYKIPKFSHKKVDFMIEVEGSSMYPKYNSGDVVACTIIKDSAFIQWNKTHVIATREQGIIIKRIKKGLEDDFLTMVSDNNSYDPFEVPKTEITGIALVVGVIRLE